MNFPPVKRESNVITKQRLPVILNVHWQELIIKLGSFFIAASLLLIYCGAGVLVQFWWHSTCMLVIKFLLIFCLQNRFWWLCVLVLLCFCVFSFIQQAMPKGTILWATQQRLDKGEHLYHVKKASWKIAQQMNRYLYIA